MSVLGRAWPHTTPAAALSGADLGSQVEFGWTFPQSNAEAVVTGELREVWHAFTEGGVVLRVLGDTDGEHTADEFTIPRDREVRVLTEGYAP